MAKSWMSEMALRRLLLLGKTVVEFSFNNVMYKQVDCVTMGSSLDPVLANICVGHCESRIDDSLWPDLYVRFVEDSL